MNASLPWYLVLFYGEPEQSLRMQVFDFLGSWLVSLDHPFIIVGDFNQVEFSSDKLSAKTGSIAGAMSFHNWRVEHELVDIPFKGPRFTWCNNRKGFRRVYERIDKAYGSKDWFSNFPNTGVKHFPIQISDHAPIELCFNLVKNSCKKPYEIESWNLHNEECTSPFRLVRKLAFIRNMLRKWSIDKRKSWSKEWDCFDERIVEAMDYTIISGNSDLAVQVNNEGRAGRNFILGIKDFAGNWTYDPICIGNLFYSHFYGIYNPISDDYVVALSTTPASSNTIIFPRLAEFDVLFQRLGALKSPGPDGYPALFFQKCWHFVKNDVISAVLNILNSGLVVTRCITNRMSRVMSYLVGEFQNAFVVGRHIGDNVILAHEAIQNINKHFLGIVGSLLLRPI
ncbi:uncharacterized protein LOC141613951 [Silene latifolia]|uniref:uncharacterized protein LOC141613951 n=1 Tax=Silene latifolia TaxID=37657 RepID=UPI003D787FDD